MMTRLIERIVRRQQRRHGTADVDRQTAAALRRIEALAVEQRREAQRVNAIYDRIAVRPHDEEDRR